jgi:hypothetical protein
VGLHGCGIVKHPGWRLRDNIDEVHITELSLGLIEQGCRCRIGISGVMMMVVHDYWIIMNSNKINFHQHS